ncbi:MAG: magnesium/cobalt transporter CorA [Cytophagaceae bacterium]|nr:magnesium/cobalt transporter CorA [Cytophagaceae bacterium]
MANPISSASPHLGTSPGTLVYVGPETKLDVCVRRIEYNEQFIEETELKTIAECRIQPMPENQVTWLDVDGIHKPEVIAEIGKLYNLHPLLLEDVLNTRQKPKLDQYDGPVVFVVMKMLEYNPYTREVEQEHVSFVLGPHYLISFQEERTDDIFTPVMERLRASVGKTRRNGPDYLLYALMDLVVDNYFLVLGKIEEDLERLEDEIFRAARTRNQNELYALKRDLSVIRKSVWPLREILTSFIREDEEDDLVSANTLLYLRDVADHIIQVLDTLDNYREWVASLLDLYHSTLSTRMNNTMKVLTVFSAIFMPLTFVVGIYGMNFDNMPELKWHYGYYLVLGAMAVIVVVMLLWFRRKGWLE